MIKKCLIIAALCFPIAVNAKGSHKLDTTPEAETGIVTVQIEDNYYHDTNSFDSNGNLLPVDTDYINATIGYSFDFGLTVQAATYNCPLLGGGAQNFECDSYINIIQHFDLTEQFGINFGSQNGTVFNVFPELHNVDFGLLSYQVTQDIEIHAGSYFVNSYLATIPVDVIDVTTGFVVKFNEKFSWEMDYFGGHNNLSGAQLNWFYKSYYLGVIIPESGSGNQYAGVVGMRITSW